MGHLFLKDEEIRTSPPIIGYRLLKLMKEKKLDRISIFDVADHFEKEKWFSTKHLYFGMLFLFSLGLIDFNQTYIVKNVQN